MRPKHPWCPMPRCDRESGQLSPAPLAAVCPPDSFHANPGKKRRTLVSHIMSYHVISSSTMFRDVPRCSTMFHDVPRATMILRDADTVPHHLEHRVFNEFHDSLILMNLMSRAAMSLSFSQEESRLSLRFLGPAENTPESGCSVMSKAWQSMGKVSPSSPCRQMPYQHGESLLAFVPAVCQTLTWRWPCQPTEHS